eukprot:Pgem_evm1s4829
MKIFTFAIVATATKIYGAPAENGNTIPEFAITAFNSVVHETMIEVGNKVREMLVDPITDFNDKNELDFSESLVVTYYNNNDCSEQSFTQDGHVNKEYHPINKESLINEADKEKKERAVAEAKSEFDYLLLQVRACNNNVKELEKQEKVIFKKELENIQKSTSFWEKWNKGDSLFEKIFNRFGFNRKQKEALKSKRDAQMQTMKEMIAQMNKGNDAEKQRNALAKNVADNYITKLTCFKLMDGTKDIFQQVFISKNAKDTNSTMTNNIYIGSNVCMKSPTNDLYYKAKIVNNVKGHLAQQAVDLIFGDKFRTSMMGILVSGDGNSGEKAMKEILVEFVKTPKFLDLVSSNRFEEGVSVISTDIAQVMITNALAVVSGMSETTDATRSVFDVFYNNAIKIDAISAWTDYSINKAPSIDELQRDPTIILKYTLSKYLKSDEVQTNIYSKADWFTKFVANKLKAENKEQN